MALMTEIDSGTISVRIRVPFTLRELAGPWSWMSIRYYWFVYDELMSPYYLTLAERGHDPIAGLMRPAQEDLAGNVELALERTNLAFLVTNAASGSVILEVRGAWKALKSLSAWLPLYGKWLQHKGQIDIKTEIERSQAVIEISRNFTDLGIDPAVARKMAFHRLYSAWPDFYAGASRALEKSITVDSPRKTPDTLKISEADIKSLLPPTTELKSIENIERSRLPNSK